MPEGDTILRAARTLQKAIGGRPLTGFSSVLEGLAEADLSGRHIDRVRARGKNLLVHFDDGRVLRTHMMMRGSWHIYRPGERWRRGRHRAHAVLETDDWIAVCFDAPVVELLESEAHSEPLRNLGPDLLDPEVDYALAALNLRGRGGTLPLGEAVMRQHLVAGIGNVYKSECLFLHRLDPFRAAGEYDEETLRAMLETASTLMGQNLDGKKMRVTRRAFDGHRLWVYGRSGAPCLRCRTAIRMRRQGDDGRSTYFCRACQRVGAPA